ncbi:YceI family protein [Aequorivita echinoideorum]|uniref:YceI family protein n=1 Tax=Aequorivita echinoideorum TaxID=1549647 RepID=A0ABS5S4W7_9FLAO|nr:YceI family protein [Aequorivita echinoideorum]MBT0608251.1 YceI family protein [Aequorivita echinoideorum]
MKTTILNLALIAFIGFGATSCKDGNKETEMETEEAATASEMAVDYKVDTAASEILWEGSKPTGSHNGTIKLASGTISANQGALEAGNFTIDMKSITDTDLEGEQKTNLEAHLMGTVEGQEGDFFNVNQYPTAMFEMTGAENNMIKGNLTIKDKTNAVEFPATVTMDGDKLMIKSEPFTIDRTKWGVNYGSKSVFDNLGDKFINDDMKITVNVVANKA